MANRASSPQAKFARLMSAYLKRSALAKPKPSLKKRKTFKFRVWEITKEQGSLLCEMGKNHEIQLATHMVENLGLASLYLYTDCLDRELRGKPMCKECARPYMGKSGVSMTLYDFLKKNLV